MSNKLSLKEFVKSTSRMDENGRGSVVSKQEKTEKSRFSVKEGKRVKLNTLPCEEIERDSKDSEQFLFRSTWQGDMENLKQEMKGCTSPTFATQILSTGGCNNNNSSSSGLFHAGNVNSSQMVEQGFMGSSTTTNRTSVKSRSRSKSRSMQKFIGDSRGNGKMGELGQNKDKERDGEKQLSGEERLMLEVSRLGDELQGEKRERTKVQERYLQLKEINAKLEEQLSLFKNSSNSHHPNNANNTSTSMSNQDLLQKMRSQSFWKFYLKAEKMIRGSVANESVIDFMKELEALRGLTGDMRKENKLLKKVAEDRLMEIDRLKDTVNVQEALIQEQRLKCVAYESAIRKLRQQIATNKKDLEKLYQVKQVQNKLSAKVSELAASNKQVALLNQQLEEQRLLNGECEKERVAAKRKSLQLQEEVNSLNKQLMSLKTSYNLLQMEKQQLSANKNELIEKEKLKQRVFQYEKELKTVNSMKEQEMNRLRQQMERQLELREKKYKELEKKMEAVVSNNMERDVRNEQLVKQIGELRQEKAQLETLLKQREQKLSCVKDESEHQLSQLSSQLQSLNEKLSQQSFSLSEQQQMIAELKGEIDQKEIMLKQSEEETQRLRLSIVEGQRACQKEGEKESVQGQMEEMAKKIEEMGEYIKRLEAKHNEALEMYQQVHNQKVQLQMQLQCCSQQLQTYQSYDPSQSVVNNPLHLDINTQQISEHTEDILSIISSMMTIKEEIIRKILIFCPMEYRELFVEYIYCGDVIKEKWMEVVKERMERGMIKRSNQDGEVYQGEGQQQGNQEQCYQQEYGNENDERQQQQPSQCYYQSVLRHRQLPSSSTLRTPMHTMSTRSREVGSRAPMSTTTVKNNHDNYTNSNQPYCSQEQIDILLEEFVKIGDIIDEQTNNRRVSEKMMARKVGKERRQIMGDVKKGSVKENNINQQNQYSVRVMLGANLKGERGIKERLQKTNVSKMMGQSIGVTQMAKKQQAIHQQQQRAPLQQTAQQQTVSYTISRPLFGQKPVANNSYPMSSMGSLQMSGEQLYLQKNKQSGRVLAQNVQQREMMIRRKNNFNHGKGNSNGLSNGRGNFCKVSNEY